MEQRQAVHSYDTITSTYVQVSSLSPTAHLTHYSRRKRSEVEDVMVHAPCHLAYMVESAFVKVPWSIVWQEADSQRASSSSTCGRHAFSLQVCWCSLRGCTTLTGGIGAQWVIKSLSALPSAGVSASCRHAVSHFKPAMTIWGSDTCCEQVSCCYPPEIKDQSVQWLSLKQKHFVLRGDGGFISVLQCDLPEMVTTSCDCDIKCKTWRKPSPTKRRYIKVVCEI